MLETNINPMTPNNSWQFAPVGAGLATLAAAQKRSG